MSVFNQYAPWQNSCEFYEEGEKERCKWVGRPLMICNCEAAKDSKRADEKLEEL